MSASARRGFERLRSSPKPGISGRLGDSVIQGAMRGVQGFDYLAFIDQISGAIRFAWATWQATATLVGVKISAVTASGGTVVGPPWEPLILSQSPVSPTGRKLSQSIAAGLGGAWLQLTASMSVPGLPWYPAFAAMSMPVAPPTPNIPGPIAMLTMASQVVSKDALKNAMVAKHLGASRADQILFEALAEAFEQAFQVWKVSTLVTNVLGTGPIPTFAPPYVPVGPVVGGTGIMTPGGFV
jgi:hypothetical protein